MMSLCVCSLISPRPSPLIYDSNFPWNLNPNRSVGPLTFSTHGNDRSFVARVAQRGYEVDNISLQSPTIEAEEENEVVDELVNGSFVAEPVEEDTPRPVRVRKKRDDGDGSDDESFEDRFKLRNGREVNFYFILSVQILGKFLELTTNQPNFFFFLRFLKKKLI